MMPTARPATDRHIPALDGVRGLAIALVLMFHFTDWSNGASQWLRAGWIGVDLFFVLSGFLITGILLDTKESPNYFGSFYARRSLRIFPLYFGVLAAVFLIGPLLGARAIPGFDELAAKQGWLWTYTSNIYLSLTGRIDLRAGWLDLNHFWSLAVEEHFYLFWPAVVLVLSRRRLIRACVICMILAPLTRIIMIAIWSRPLGTYVLTCCRIDSLAVGGLMAAMGRGVDGLPAIKERARQIAIAGALVVAALGLRSGRIAAADRVMQMVGFSALGLAFAGLVVLASVACPGGFWHRLWTGRLLTSLGRYSYGIYVYHQIFGRKLVEAVSPRLTWAGPIGSSLLMIAVGIAVNLAVAMISYHGFEAPFLRLKSRFRAEETPAVTLSRRSSASTVPA